MLPKIYRVVLTERALRGLRGIHDHITRSGSNTAAEVGRKIINVRQ